MGLFGINEPPASFREESRIRRHVQSSVQEIRVAAGEMRWHHHEGIGYWKCWAPGGSAGAKLAGFAIRGGWTRYPCVPLYYLRRIDCRSRLVQRSMRGVQAVFHAATLHKPHVATHRRQEFVDTDITGTLNLLEEAVAGSVESFVYTSTTSVFGDALVPPEEAPAAWITENVTPVPKNIYGVTKAAAEDLCELFHRNQGLACIVLRTSRFFPEEDDNPQVRNSYCGRNAEGQ